MELPSGKAPIMCEFCLKHGEGKKWYLEAKNYSDDLLSDLRRRRFIEGFVSRPEDIANVVSFLVSEDASYVSGQTIYVAGGPKG